MRLFRRCHYRLVKGGDGDRDRCLIIVAARRVGDGPFLEAICTASVCAELDIPITELLTGAEIEALSDEALAARLEETNLFCRVTPAQKNRIILGLRHRGHVVGFSRRPNQRRAVAAHRGCRHLRR
jgi:hypothetical protein